MFFPAFAFFKNLKLIQIVEGFTRRTFFILQLNLESLDGPFQICAALR